MYDRLTERLVEYLKSQQGDGAANRAVEWAKLIVDRASHYTLDDTVAKYAMELAATPVKDWWSHNQEELVSDDVSTVEFTQYDFLSKKAVRRVIFGVAQNLLHIFVFTKGKNFVVPYGVTWDPEANLQLEKNQAKLWQAMASGYRFNALDEKSASVSNIIEEIDYATNIRATQAVLMNREESLKVQHSLLASLGRGEISTTRLAMAVYSITRLDRVTVEKNSASRTTQTLPRLPSSDITSPHRSVHEVTMRLIPKTRKLAIKAYRHARQARARHQVGVKRHKVSGYTAVRNGKAIKVDPYLRGDEALGWSQPNYRIKLEDKA